MLTDCYGCMVQTQYTIIMNTSPAIQFYYTSSSAPKWHALTEFRLCMALLGTSPSPRPLAPRLGRLWPLEGSGRGSGVSKWLGPSEAACRGRPRKGKRW